MAKKINIAIDGYSSCGKSTMARQLANKLHYIYLDTGAMYRAVTYYFLLNHIDHSVEGQVQSALSEIKITFKRAKEAVNAKTFMNGQNVEQHIRSMEVTRNVSQVSTNKLIRQAMVKQQQEIAESKGTVMDGRDIGSVVLPTAELKIFMTASPEVRTERRFNELRDRGVNVTKEEVRNNLEERDFIDSHREESPLLQAEDAIILDNSDMTPEEQLDWALQKAIIRINK